MTTSDLRNRVGAQLEELHRPTGALHSEALHASWRIHADDPRAEAHDVRYTLERARVHTDIIEQYLARQTGISTDGHAAVVTAGAPGAGKSTRLDTLGYDNTWRRIDADVVKTILIDNDLAFASGTFPGGVETLILEDGGHILPAELASLYHHESTAVADQLRDRALILHENVIIEGTLSWQPIGNKLVTELTVYDYADLDVVLVDVPLDVALEQAKQRWWQGRQGGPPGGRFTPEASIRSMYPTTPAESQCAANARQLVTDAGDAGLRVQLRT